MRDQIRVDSEGVIVLARAPAFQLGLVEVRPSTREVISRDERERLEPRVMQVLVLLNDARGEVVGRDELFRSCWEGRVVGEDAINRVIARIRRLGATLGKDSFGVETIIKSGYRLYVADEGSGPQEAPAEPPAVEAPKPNRRAVLALGAGALTAAGAAGWWWLDSGAASSVPEAALRLQQTGVAASRLGTVEGTAQGVGHLQEAVRIAPDYAEGWGSLALAYQSGAHFAPGKEASANDRRVRSAAERALAIDPGNASAQAALAIRIPQYGNWLALERALRQVLAIDPHQFECCSMLSRTLASVGRTREAIAALDPIGEPMRMQPAMQFWLAFLLWCTGRIEESDRVIDRAMTLWPRNYQVWFTRFWLYVFTGEPRRAIAMAGDIEHRPPGIPDWNFALIEQSAQAVLARSANTVDAALAANLRVAREGVGFAENAIELASELAHADTAYTVADAYYFGRGFAIGATRFTAQQGSYTPRSRLNTKFLFNPSTAAMRADARFAELVERIGLADYWRSSKSSADLLAR